MITFKTKTEPQPAPAAPEENRFEQIRVAAKKQHRKSETDQTRRRTPSTEEDGSLI